MKRSKKTFFSANFELLAWGLILLVFVAGVSHISRKQVAQETALGLSDREFAGSPEMGR